MYLYLDTRTTTTALVVLSHFHPLPCSSNPISRRSLLGPATRAVPHFLLSFLFFAETFSFRPSLSATVTLDDWHSLTLLQPDPPQLLASGCLSHCEPLDETGYPRESSRRWQSPSLIQTLESTLIRPLIEAAIRLEQTKELPRPHAVVSTTIEPRLVAGLYSPSPCHNAFQSLATRFVSRPLSWQRGDAKATMTTFPIESLPRQLQPSSTRLVLKSPK